MPPDPLPNRLGLGVLIALFAFCFFAAASSTVFAFQGKFPTIQIIFIQNLVSWLCISPLALRFGIKRLQTGVLWIHLMRDVFGVLSYLFYFLAIRHLNLVDATLLNYTAPILIPFVLRLWLKEPISPHIWYSILLGFFGVMVILNPSYGIFSSGFWYGILAGTTSAIALSAVRVLNIKGEPLSRTLFYYFLIGTLGSLPFAWDVWIAPTGGEWFLAGWIGFATAIGQILLTQAYKYGTASYLSPLGYSTVIYTGLFSYFVYGKEIGLGSIAGTVLIIIGGTLTFFFKKRESLKEVFIRPKPEKKDSIE